MRLLVLITVLLCTFRISAQNNVNADCINAIPLCNVPTFTFYATSGVGTYTDIPKGNTISNPTTNPASSNSGCLLSDELNPQWLMITVGNPGMLEFIFGAAGGSNPQVGFYDWAMWKYTPNTCADIFNNTLAPVRCNWNGSSSGGTGIASSTNQPSGSSPSNFEPPLQVNACDQFIICISNYSGVNTLVGFQNIGTASLSCDPNCLSVTNASLCAGGTATIVAANSGTLTNLTYSMNPGGFVSNTPTFVVSPPATGNYTVFATGLNIANVPVTQTAVATVTVFNTPSVSPTFTNTTCTNTFNAYNINLSFVPSVTPAPSYTINWSTPSGLSTSTITSATGGLLPGPYSGTVISPGGCSTVAQFTMSPKPDPAPITLSPAGPVYSITCFQPTVTITALQPSYNYTWTNQLIADKTGTVAEFNYTGVSTWTITSHNPVSGCMNTRTIVIGMNTVTPVTTVTPLYQTISCTLAGVSTVTASSNPSVNVTHSVMSPLGAPFSASSYSIFYVPGYPGTYTHVTVNNINGCKATKTFTVFSNDTYPTFDVLSAPSEFTLGCGTKSIITVNLLNGQLPPGGPVTFTLLSPSSSSVLPGGSLGSSNTFTSVNSPGTWTAVVRANQSGCDTRLPFSVLSNTFAPSLDSLVVPRNILTCDHPSVTLKGISLTPNIKYTWSFKGPGSQAGDTLSVYANFAAPSATVVDNYSLTIEDNNNTCKTFTVVPVAQNIFPPVARIGSTGSITCVTSTIELTNQSASSIPANTFPRNAQVIGFIWRGPSPQVPGYNLSSYVAHGTGQYSLTAKDLNNGCLSQTVTTVGENKLYPVLNDPEAPVTPSLGCGDESARISPNISTPTTNLSYSWTASPGFTVNGLQSRTLTVYQPGLYRVLVTDKSNGCSSTTNMQVGTGTLHAGFTPERTGGFAPLLVNFKNTSANSAGVTSSITSLWVFGNGQTASFTTAADVATVYDQPGTYTVTLFTRRGSCIDSTHRVIEVEIPSAIVVPNVFTPNGDGANDLFFLQRADNLSEISADITDRWGRKVYTIVSSTGQIEWDGTTMSGAKAAEGVYFYIITAKGTDGEAYELKGTVTLLR